MDDINKQVQLEVLAKHLKDNGIACSYEEANEKAKTMINCSENKEEIPDEKIQIMEQRYKFMLNSQKDKFTKEIDSLKSSISTLQSALDDLKKQVTTPKVKKKEVQTTFLQTPKPVEEEKQETVKEEPPTNGQEDLNPDDFAVDKIFYYGQK